MRIPYLNLDKSCYMPTKEFTQEEARVPPVDLPTNPEHHQIGA